MKSELKMKRKKTKKWKEKKREKVNSTEKLARVLVSASLS